MDLIFITRFRVDLRNFMNGWEVEILFFAEKFDIKYGVRDKEWWKDFENNLSQLSVSTVLSSHSNLFSINEYNNFTYKHLYRIEDTIKDDLENELLLNLEVIFENG